MIILLFFVCVTLTMSLKCCIEQGPLIKQSLGHNKSGSADAHLYRLLAFCNKMLCMWLSANRCSLVRKGIEKASAGIFWSSWLINGCKDQRNLVTSVLLMPVCALEIPLNSAGDLILSVLLLLQWLWACWSLSYLFYLTLLDCLCPGGWLHHPVFLGMNHSVPVSLTNCNIYIYTSEYEFERAGRNVPRVVHSLTDKEGKCPCLFRSSQLKHSWSHVAPPRLWLKASQRCQFGCWA